MWWVYFMGTARHRASYTATSTLPPATYYTLSTTTTGSGSVTSNPTGINCGSGCSASFFSGTPVVLTATGASGYQFSGWSGDCSGQNGSTCTIVMDGNKSAAAEFIRTQYPLTVSRTGTGSGTVTSNPSGINCGNAYIALLNVRG